MSVTAVPASPKDVLEGTPIKGSVEDVNAVGEVVSDVSLDAWSFSTALVSAQQALRGNTADTIAKLEAKIGDSLTQGTTALQESADSAKSAFDTYAAEVDRIHTDARKARSSVEECLATIRSQSDEIETVARTIGASVWYGWEEGAPGQMPEPRPAPASKGLTADEELLRVQQLRAAYEARWFRAASLWHTSVEEVRSARTTWNQLIEDRRIAEGLLVGSLETTPVGQLITLTGGGVNASPYTIASGIAGELWGVETSKPSLQRLDELLSGELVPEEAARLWAQLQAEGVDTDQLIERFCFELANINGLPFSVMDAAGRAALDYALDPEHPENLGEAFSRMGFADGERSLEDFRTDLQAVQDALRDAMNMVLTGDTIQLVALGRHDGVVTAGISMGDLDEASTVGVFVSGMMSDVRGIGDAFDAFKKIRGGNTDMAMLTWIGYRSPTMLEEAFQARADAGGKELAAFLDGMAVQREDNPISRLAVLGHSYGTNVIAEALKETKAHVNAYVTLGSAGLRLGTTAESLGVDEIHVTHAAGDNIAPVGQVVHVPGPLPRLDPALLSGAHVFTSEKTVDGEAVTMHNLVNPIDWQDMLPVRGLEAQWFADHLDGMPADKEIGYLNPDASTVNGLKDIMWGDWR